MIQATYDKMLKIHLKAMAHQYQAQENIPGIHDMTFDERLSLLIDAEADSRENATIARRKKEAKLPETSAALESIQYLPDRHLNRNLITSLASDQYIHKPTNIFLVGASGSGKTYIASALGNRACEENYKVKYIRMPDMFNDFEIAKLENTKTKLLKHYHTRDLLIIDDWLLYSITEEQRQIIMEIIEGRYRTRATIICSQYDTTGWLERLGIGPVSEAILDRLTPKSQTIKIDGNESMRLRI